MPSAHCICPDFLSRNISDPRVFQKVFMEVLLGTDDQIILDVEGRLLLEYMNSVKDDQNAFGFFKVWQLSLEGRVDGKVLLTSVPVVDDVKDYIFDIVTHAATTFNKDIIVHDNNHYERFIAELSRQRISLLNLQNLTSQGINTVLKKNSHL